MMRLLRFLAILLVSAAAFLPRAADAAGSLYVNGVRADGLRAFTFTVVDVRVDQDGNVWVDAPRYRVESPGQAPPVGSLYVNGVQADGLRSFEFTAVNLRVDDAGNTWIDAPLYKVEVQGAAPPPQVSTEPIPQGAYWLVTQDNASSGHTLHVVINGVIAREIRSGEPTVILDLQPYLRRGVNQVQIIAQPGAPGGGVLFVYLGAGANQAGTVTMGDPDVVYARRGSDSPAGGTQSFTLQVP